MQYIYIYIHTKHLLTVLVQVTMMFRALHGSHKFDIVGILDLGSQSLSQTLQGWFFDAPIKQKRKVGINFFFQKSVKKYQIDDQSFSLGLICTLEEKDRVYMSAAY